MTLKETVKQIKEMYNQEFILLNEFDYLNGIHVAKQNPKYLFRGEQIYDTTKSNYHRLINNPSINLEEIQKYVLDLSIYLVLHIKPDIDPSKPDYCPTINEITGYLQHYGFPIMYLDFTQNIDIAAFFSSYNNQIGKGRICVVRTSDLIKNEERILKLTYSLAKRPILQEAFALKMYNDKPDLKNQNHFNTMWFDFEVTTDDILSYSNRHLLSTQNDFICDLILTYINDNKSDNKIIQDIFNDLRDKKTGHNST